MAVEQRCPMKTHPSPLAGLATLRVGRVLVVVALAMTIAGPTALALAGDTASDTTKKPESETRLYTNADLAKYATETGASTSSKEYAPQPVTSHDTKEGWDFVFAMIDREHEKAARSKEAADAAAAAYEASKYEPEPTYYAPYYGFGYAYNNGCFHGDCGHGCNGPFTHRSNCTPQGTNTFRPLDERGVRTPQDLWREMRRNTAIQRSQIIAPPQGFAIVPTNAPMPHR